MANKQLQKLELTWIGKGEEPKLEPRILIEQPEYSYGDRSTENMLIHGDNLLALKALEQDYAGKIKCIYIDPPFNTGAAFEHYDDGIEHSIWLNLMYSRFKLLHNLLSDEGSIFIHLDDNEAAYCKVLLDEVFGRFNYINQIVNATNKAFGFKSTSSGLFKQANHIFFYCKDKAKFQINTSKLFIEKGYDSAYKYIILNPDEPEKFWKWENVNESFSRELGYKDFKEAKAKIGDLAQPLLADFAIRNANRIFQTVSVSGGAYLKRKDTIKISSERSDEVLRHPNDDMDYQFIGGRRLVFYSERLKEIDGQLVPGELITDIWHDISIEALALEGGVDFPKGKKPEKLIQRCIEMTTESGDIVLDSFLGSGTTAAVAHKMGRRYIGIELGEHAKTHCVPRLQKVIQGEQGGISKAVNWKGGGGFKFYTLAPSLLNKDSYGNWVISQEYNPDMLAAAMAKQEGFKYAPVESVYWKQGKSSEKDFIFTTTQFLTVEALDAIFEQMKPDESLLITCKAFQKECKNRHSNITIKKIPQMLLGKCEFGKDDYSLNIVNMPIDNSAMDEEVDTEVKLEATKAKKKKSSGDSSLTLFD